MVTWEKLTGGAIGSSHPLGGGTAATLNGAEKMSSPNSIPIMPSRAPLSDRRATRHTRRETPRDGQFSTNGSPGFRLAILRFTTKRPWRKGLEYRARSRWPTIMATSVRQMPEYSMVWLLMVPTILIDAVSCTATAESSPESRFQKLTVIWLTKS